MSPDESGPNGIFWDFIKIGAGFVGFCIFLAWLGAKIFGG